MGTSKIPTLNLAITSKAFKFVHNTKLLLGEKKKQTITLTFFLKKTNPNFNLEQNGLEIRGR